MRPLLTLSCIHFIVFRIPTDRHLAKRRKPPPRVLELCLPGRGGLVGAIPLKPVSGGVILGAINPRFNMATTLVSTRPCQAKVTLNITI
jgi:hypothetical protein